MLVGAIREIMDVSKQGPCGFIRVRVGGCLRIANARSESKAYDRDD